MHRFILTLLFLIALPACALAQDADKLVKIRLVPETAQITGGQTLLIGIEQSIAPEWHTYWRNPGDSGTAPRIKWILPDGFEIGEVQWPVPHKLPYGPLLNYGYAEHTILLQQLTVPSALPEGPITLSADVEVLVCKEECIPEYGTYTLTLNDGMGEAADNSAYFTKAQRTIPGFMDWPAQFREQDGGFTVEITPDTPEFFDNIDAATLEFFPVDWGLIDNTAKPAASFENGKIILTQKRGDRPLDKLADTRGVIAYKSPTGAIQSFEFAAKKEGLMAKAMEFSDAEQTTSLWSALLFALLGGLILNLMPCVFPVLSIKALSLVKIAEKHPTAAKFHGLAYTAGVVLSFVLIAAILIALKAGGSQIGWGFQLQNPYVVGALALLLLTIGLNMAGVFEIRNPFGNLGGKLASGGGYSGSFFTGVLATLVATPCTAPFMAGAIAYALLQSEIVALGIFAALGFGLALPYLLLSIVPAFQKMLPRPGRWMETFRKILSVPMFLAALWLGWVLTQQIGPQNHDNLEFGSAYSESALEAALKTDQPVFVEMTAAWCITCKVNHKTSIDIDSTKTLFKEKNVIYLVGDWTNEDPAITKFLQGYGRSGVPIYVYYAPPERGQRPQPKVLPQVLTPAIVQNTLTGSN